MKKRLLMAALAVVSALSTYAFEQGEYVYTTTGRVKVTGANLVENPNFASGTDGWTDAEGESVSTDTWSVEKGLGPNGENVLKSLGATAGAALCGRWAPETAGTYVVSFDIFGEADGNLAIMTVKDGVTTIPNNCADFFLNTDGNRTKEGSTDEAPVTNIATSVTYVNGWKKVSFTANVEQGQFIVMHFEKLLTGLMVTNFAVQAAEQVFDDRIAKSKINYIKKLMDDPNFNTTEAADARAELAGVIETIEGMLATGAMDDPSQAENVMAAFEESAELFLGVTSENIATEEYFKYVTDLTTFPKYNRGNISNGQVIGGFIFRGDNWQHADGGDVLVKQIQGGGSYQVGPGSVALKNDKMPAGKYFISAEMRNARCNKDYSLVFNHEAAVKAFVGTDSVLCGTIVGEEYTQFYFVGELKKGETLETGFWWDGPLHDGRFEIKNFQVRRFGESVADQVAHQEAWTAFKTQWDAATSRLETVKSMIADKAFPWENDSLKQALAVWEPFYTDIVNKGWVAADGSDAGVATTDELNNWAKYQGGEIPEDEKATYQLVRGLDAAINYVKAANKSLTDLAAAISVAKATLVDDMYSAGDKATFQKAIDAAQAALDNILNTTSDATSEADAAKAVAAMETLQAAEQAFKDGGALQPIVDIDFSNAAVEDTENGGFYIEGAKGKMTFAGFQMDSTVGDTNFTLGSGEEYLDVLRVGKGDAVVLLDEADVPTDADALRVQFDMWVGGLINRNVYVDLRNEANTRVAGFSYCLYGGSTAYNDFNDENNTFNIAAYGKGTGKTENGALVADTYKFSFDLVVDYKAGTVQGHLTSSPTGVHDGEPVQMIALDDNKVVKFVLGSNYDNSGRRSWFDNLKIFKYASSSVSGIETVENNVAPTTGIYTLTGVKLEKAPAKGMYIKNGKKYVVK